MAFFKRKTRGAQVKYHKNTEDMALVKMPAPARVWITMNQHNGLVCDVLVKKGEQVSVGQRIGNCSHALGVPAHSSVSGTIAAFDEIVLPTGDRATAIAIDADGKQTMDPSIIPPVITDHASLLDAVWSSGMVGLGGAGFPTHVKLNPPNLKEVDTLLVNAAECEPFLTVDYRVMLEQSEDILFAIDVLLKHTGIANCAIAIEDNKPKAIETMREAIANRNNCSIAVLPSIYPQGAEKMLIDQALGRVVPEGSLPANVGTIVLNITTVATLGRFFQDGIPLIEKNVTVAGDAIQEPKNIKVPIGTTVADIASFCGGYKTQPHKILMGGPMMGLTIYDESYPLLKNNNGLLFFDEKQSFRFEETPCIICGRCTRACPMYLMPFQLKRANEREDLEALHQYKMNLCIECGCCSYVCPARQELVQSHKMSKRKLRKEKEGSKE